MGEGRLFRFDFTEAARKSALVNHERVASTGSKSSPVEHFWLCANCAMTMTVGLSDAGEIQVIPLETATPKISAVSSRKKQKGREAAAS